MFNLFVITEFVITEFHCTVKLAYNDDGYNDVTEFDCILFLNSVDVINERFKCDVIGNLRILLNSIFFDVSFL